MLLGSISFTELPPTTVLEQAVICGGLVSDEGPVELGGGPPGPEADVAGAGGGGGPGPVWLRTL